MNADRDVAQRSREWFHQLAVPQGMRVVIRVDGRGFTKLVEAAGFDRPFDSRFAASMEGVAGALLTQFGGSYAETHSDEVSVLLPAGFGMFDRGVEKLVSVAAGVATEAFESSVGGHFDARLWIGLDGDVADYFVWRQEDSVRNALNGYCYWSLRGEGLSARRATEVLSGLSRSGKNELLFARGVNFGEVPVWQRRGVGVWWESFEKEGLNPVLGEAVVAVRRRLGWLRELPSGDEYRAHLAGVVAAGG